ncbi:MAG TPA: glycosyltransferase family A protein [Lacibacter sp.]|nr:glycosyltransferase family A protein [Lacibacter sp.]HMO88662.1 glycosyltransferase family A protein [Lacibacter sp.]
MSSSVQVIIPNYNHASYLLQRLKTVSGQTYGAFQAHVLDDCSTDASRDIIDTFVVADARFSRNYNSVNSGSTFKQWNKGIAQAKGDYIWIAESDDAADEHLLESLVKKLEENPETVLAYCQSYRMNQDGEITGNWQSFTDEMDEEQFKADFIMEGKEYIRRFLIHRNTIPNASAVVFRKAVYDQAGGAPESLRTNGDWLVWLKMLCHGKVAFVAQPLNYFRYHGCSVIAKHKLHNDEQVYKEQYDYSMRSLFESFVKREQISLPPEVLRINRQYMRFDSGNKGLFYLKQRKYISGWREICNATFQWPFRFGYFKMALGWV